MGETDLSPHLAPYRPNVGVVLFRPDGRVWLGRRAGAAAPNNWQFPQGGVDPDEDLQTAALRELAEETGVRTVTLLGRTDGWLTYDFPPEHGGSPIGRAWKGQRQVWFALRFDGLEQEIDLGAHPPPEFDAWRWAYLDEAPKIVAPFKQAIYRQVVAAFSVFAAG
ncbi:MAG: RNA pyrophosphohydrolase [Phenylobacterium sp.]|uniref:RNA pyrophosphohydrolase n=1 Tax=Phenylobacterium sp. TaxID=1871053 RepID=UPI0027196934|nr:RNA pyrophosphohydrolase [Phenylobacterium sp.]MDO8408965.1 RNA pyrophosphohydrolase [Phenylobacterium sp.]